MKLTRHNGRAGKDGVEVVFLEVSSPFGIGSDLELHGDEDGAEHVNQPSICGCLYTGDETGRRNLSDMIR